MTPISVPLVALKGLEESAAETRLASATGYTKDRLDQQSIFGKKHKFVCVEDKI